MAKRKVTKKTVTTTVEETVVDGKTLLVDILDSSGSMASTINEARSGFNDFLKKQKEEEGETTITVAMFDTAGSYDVIYENTPLEKTSKITEDQWYPRGMTALFDAIGKTVINAENSIKKMKKKDRPDKVLVTIVTDGQENDSKEYVKSDIKKLIKRLEKKGWSFMYIGANQDAFAEGGSMGFSVGNTVNYVASSTGTANMFTTLSNATSLYRTRGLAGTSDKSLMADTVGGDTISDDEDKN